jgi:DNA-binding IclR family transcriptional regulator
MSNMGASGETPTNGDNPGSVQSVDSRLGESGVTDLADDLQVHKSTAFRLLATLEAHGLVEQNEGRGKYRLGVGLLRLAGATSARLDVVQEARPICKDLAAATGETVNLATISGGQALYLDQVAGRSNLQTHNWVGQHIPLHATSNGKVLLAGLSADQLAATVGKLEAYTSATVATMPALRRELDKVKAQGFALAIDELEMGLTAIAAPVFGAHGDVLASISVSGPTFRIGESRVAEFGPLVIDAGHQISHRLGWAGP